MTPYRRAEAWSYVHVVGHNLLQNVRSKQDLDLLLRDIEKLKELAESLSCTNRDVTQTLEKTS